MNWRLPPSIDKQKDLLKKSLYFCSICRKILPIQDFRVFKTGWPQNSCISCQAPYRARGMVTTALKKGTLVKPKKCSLCGKSRGKKIVGHHESYEPGHELDVQWVCTNCHAKIHARKNKERKLERKKWEPYFMPHFMQVI